MKKNKEKNYKEETATSLANFISEVANYVLVVITAIVTMSLSLFMDLINSTCNLLRTGFATFLSKRLQKNLKFKYNYGTDKLEALSMVFCDSLLVIGTLAILCFAVYQLIYPSQMSKDLIMAVILKSVNVTADVVLLIVNLRVYKKNKTKVSKSNFEGALSCLTFDFAIFVSVLLAFIFSKWGGVVYVEPAASVLISFFVIGRAIKRIKEYAGEIVNITLKEEDQIKIDSVLAKYFDRYDEFYAVDSHKVGETIYVDFRVAFKDETTFREIKETLRLFTEELEQIFEKCKVTLILDKVE